MSCARSSTRAALNTPPPRWLPGAWSALGDTELARGNPAQAEAYFRRAIQLDGVADRRTLGLAWRGLGIAQVVRNDLDGAEQSYLRARLELEPVGDRLLLARVTDGLGYIATTRGRMADALMLYEQAADMGAAAGLNETELGSRLNIAQAHHYLLHHAIALDKLRALLPRIQAVDYPALHTFGSIAYANALIETGAFAEARAELARLHDASLDGRRHRRGRRRPARRSADPPCARRCARRGPPRRCGAPRSRHRERARPASRSAGGAVERTSRRRRSQGSGGAGRRCARVGSCECRSARARARACREARWAAASGDAAAALDDYRQALVIAREFGTPLVLRDVVVPYAKFQLDAGAIELARATASTVGPYAEDDFEIALLMGRVAAATHDADLARSYFAQARRLAGERWTRSLADEEARLAGGPAHDPASRAVAGG